MTDQANEQKTGEFFSRTYLLADKPLSDDVRARLRMAAYLDEYYDDKEMEVGKYIELELGIVCRQLGPARYYINWGRFLKELAIKDFLDVMTAVIRFLPQRRKAKDRIQVEYNLLEFAKRVFVEQNLAYRIDNKGGCHPSVDAAFSILSRGLIRNLANQELDAAQDHISQAERSLLAGSFDARQAVRSTFDAVENLAKVIFKGSTQLNKTLIVDRLGPFLVEAGGKSETERKASEKLVNSLIDWAEAAHFYRHASGSTDVDPPSESFALAFVSQGFSFVRWIADVYAIQRA